jgi:hypothetical protein
MFSYQFTILLFVYHHWLERVVQKKVRLCEFQTSLIYFLIYFLKYIQHVIKYNKLIKVIKKKIKIKQKNNQYIVY